jgi:hypothetical protein
VKRPKIWQMIKYARQKKSAIRGINYGDGDKRDTMLTR